MFLLWKTLSTALLGLVLLYREAVSSMCPVPEIRNQRNKLVIVDVVEGADVRLFCQVKDKGLKHKISVYWQKNNITLQTSSSTRMRVKLNRYLTIKRTTKDDVGLYTCVAENTCGGKNVLYIHLFVESPTWDTNRNSTPTPPKFTVPSDKMARNLIAVPIGNKVKLDCSATGYPRPTVRWYKDGALFQDGKRGSRLYLSKFTTVLVMKDVVLSDSGEYTCNVSNAYGWISHSYSVDVHELVRVKPVVLPMENVTLFVGENATLLCRALSDSMPHFQWLRWFSSPSNGSGNNSYIQHPHYTYEVIKHVEQKDNQHLVVPTRHGNKFDFHGIKLTLVNVTKKDEGKYTCIVGNAVGYAVEQAFVVVRDWSDRHVQDRTVSPFDKNTLATSVATVAALRPEVSGQRSEEPENERRFKYLEAAIGVSVAAIIALISILAWFCWQMKKRQASARSHRPDIDSILPRYEVKNEYVVVPDFK